MDNNTMNINKTNNHLSAEIIEHKKTTTHGVNHPDSGLGQAHKCGGVKSINGDPNSEWQTNINVR